MDLVSHVFLKDQIRYIFLSQLILYLKDVIQTLISYSSKKKKRALLFKLISIYTQFSRSQINHEMIRDWF